MVQILSDFKDWYSKMKGIEKIKAEYSACEEKNLPAFIKEYEEDERAGVIKLVLAAKKKQELYLLELNRLKELWKFEEKFSSGGYICGVDEVGRGPLAGPVVAAAVILPKDALLLYANDSKLLSEKKRNQLFDEILNTAICVGVGSADHQKIDEVNILNATFLAMKEAIDSLTVKPDFVLVDGDKEIPNLSIPQKAIVQGDRKSISIACASIIAKVSRDREMEELDKVYPGYSFDKNKGYGSKCHYEGLDLLGPSPIHRKRYLRKWESEWKKRKK